MNIKPSFQTVVSEVGSTQDGNKINPNDHYGNFLLSLITDNTEKNSVAPDSGEVDVEELAGNLKYAIHEFGKALAAVEKLIK